MTQQGHILIINPGSTSTKLAIYKYDLANSDLTIVAEEHLVHNGKALGLEAQLDVRFRDVDQFLTDTKVEIQVIMARGAPLRPLTGGSYLVNHEMLEDIKSRKYSNHASNFAALIGDRISKNRGAPVYITDPITTDEFEPSARISGVPGLERKSRSHALNIKASLRKVCNENNRVFENSSWVVCHMGGGISVAAVRNGRIIDVNDALLGMGPFSPERAGALPTSGILDMIFKDEHDRASLEKLLTKESGLKGYLGTADLRKVETAIRAGDSQAELIYHSMVYQIVKEISAMASVLMFDFDGVLLTGGMANSELLCKSISQRIAPITTTYIAAGENEMEAMAQAAIRILSGAESVNSYSQA